MLVLLALCLYCLMIIEIKKSSDADAYADKDADKDIDNNEDAKSESKSE